MRWACVVVVCALSARASADPPTEQIATRAAAAWFRAAAAGDANAMRAVSGPALVVSFDPMMTDRCDGAWRIRSRAAMSRLARRLARCVFAIPAERWQGDQVADDRRIVESMTMEETFYTFAVTVDARGRVVAVHERTSWGGH
jgi:hypothetical protein